MIVDVTQLQKDVEGLEELKESVRTMQKKMLELVTQDEFKETSNDVRVLKGSMEEVRSDVQLIWAELKKLRDQVDAMAFPSLEEVQMLRTRVDKLENALSSLKKVYGELEKKLKALNLPGGGADQEAVDRLLDELNKLRAEFEEHRDHANKSIDQLNHEMPTKADKQDLIDLENRILDKLRDMIQQILN